MKIAIITMWFNEEFLAPLFFKHYSESVDQIYVILDVATKDDTLEICCDSGAIVLPHEFTDGMDDQVKIDRYNEFKSKSDHDYVIALDADEFIYEPHKTRNFLEAYEPDYQEVAFHQMYQHKTEKPLNRIKNPFLQRRHGDPSLEGWNAFYVKPCIVRADLNADWQPGCHGLLIKEGRSFTPREAWKGAHWHMADVELSVKRRLAIKKRQSQANLAGNMTTHNHHITEAEIREICKKHENDPRIF